MEKKCWVCDTQITNQNSSVEHIILHACGGKLKSKEILCNNCNQKLGSNSDVELAKQLNNFSVFFNVERERKKTPPPIKGGKDSDGVEYTLKAGKLIRPALAKPQYKEELDKNENVIISVSARSTKELKKMLQGVKRKYPEFDVENAIKNAQNVEEYLDKPISLSMKIGGDLAFKSILKTAINFYIYSGGKKTNIVHLVNIFIDDNSSFPNVVWFYYPEKEPYKTEEKETSHVLHIKGIKQEKILYAYIEFFNTYCFLVKLNENYLGEDCEYNYAFDVLKKAPLVKEVHLALSRKALMEVFKHKIHPSSDTKVQKRVEKALKHVGEIQHKNKISDISSTSLNKAFEELPEGAQITEEYTDKLIDELIKEFIPYYVHITKGK